MRRHRLLVFILLAGIALAGAEAQAAPPEEQQFPFELHAKLGGQAPYIVEALDVDRDGHVDLVFDRAEGDEVALRMEAGLRQRKLRRAVERSRHGLDDEITSVEIENVDGQRGPDLVVGVGGNEGQTVEVLLRSDSAAFEHVASLPAPSEHFAVADSPETGSWIWPRRTQRGSQSGQETGTAPSAPSRSFRSPFLARMVIGCLDPVGSLQGLVGGAFVPGGGDDLVARYDDGLATMGGQLVLASKPGGGFEQGEFDHGYRGTLDFLLARDLDRDGFLDLIAGGSHGITSPFLYAVYRGRVRVQFEERSGATTLGPEPGILDADRDGDLGSRRAGCRYLG